MLPGFTPAFFGGAKPLLVDENTISLVKCDGAYMASSSYADRAKTSRIWATSGAGSTTTQGVFGSAWYGTGGSLRAPVDDPAFDLQGDFTIEMWAAVPSASSAYVLLAKAGWAWQLQTYNDQLVFLVSTNGSSWTMNLQSPPGGGATPANYGWWHIAVTRSGDTYRIFSNGNLAATGTLAGQPFKPAGSYAYVANASGVFADEIRISNVCRWTAAFARPSQPYYGKLSGGNDAATKLLMHFEGINGTTNFFDHAAGAATPHIGSVNGTAVISTTQAKFGTSSLKLDGSTNCRVSFVNSPDFNSRLGDFTIDFWIYLTGYNAGSILSTRQATAATAPYTMQVDASGNVLVWMSYDGTNWAVAGFTVAPTIALNTWTHVTMMRHGLIISCFKNGVLHQQFGFDTFLMIANGLSVGGLSDHATAIGYMDELRISDVARWPINFTPPAAAHVAESGTVLLLHMDGANGSTVITDSSDAAHGTATNVGAPSLATVTSKFGGTSLALNASSRLTYPSHADYEFGSGDFTIDWWEYRTGDIANSATVVRDTTGYPAFLCGYIHTNGMTHYISANGSGWAVTLPMGATTFNQWVHHAVVRDGNKFMAFKNGVLVATAVSSITLVASANPLSIGCYQTSYMFNGYLDEVRISKGVARWKGSFTPPAAPYAPDVPAFDATTVLLLHCEGSDGGAVFVDSSPYQKTIGVTAMTTVAAQKKFGATSGLPGASGYVYPLVGAAGDADFTFGTGDFTIDFWAMPSAAGLGGTLYDGRPTYEGPFPLLWLNAGVVIYRAASADRITAGAALSAMVWNHIAVVRSLGVTKLYINGSQSGASYTDGTNYVSAGTNRPLIGNNYVPNNRFSGWLDEVRVSKGIARWTNTFTPPTEPYA